MNLDLLEAFFGKRYSGLITCVALLGAAYFWGPVEKFPTLATTLGLLYGAYVTGQSITDSKDK